MAEIATSSKKPEMEVLVLGLCRTGTQSIAMALELLGFKPIYHMKEVGKNGHQDRWIAAMEAKFEGKGKEFGREEWDDLLGCYAGVSDLPAAIFPLELVTAYPNAKVILSLRNEDSWYNSMLATIWHAWVAPDANKSSPMRRLSDKYHEYLWKSDFPQYGREHFRKHNDFVRNIVPAARLLEFDVVKGWKPLVEFLEKEIPDVLFPRADDWAEYKASHKN